MQRLIVILWGGFALLCCVLLTGCHEKKEAAGPATVSPYVVDVITVTPRAFRETLFATGTLRPRESVELKAERAGVVKEIRFEEGKPVKTGEVLVVIDDSELRAQLERAEAQLKLAEATEKRNRELFQTGGFISASEYDQSRANLQVAQAEVNLIAAQLKKTRLVAPFDGIAGLRQVSVGAYLNVGAPIASFQDISSLKLDFTLSEQYLPNLRDAQRVTFRIAGRPDTVSASIYAIEPAIDVMTRSLTVRAVAQNTGQGLLPGSFAEVEVALEEIPDAILIPPIALVPGLKEQKVFIHKAGAVEERQVMPGLRSANAIQIIKGLQAGEEVVTSGILQLRPGMKVKAKPVEKGPPNTPPVRARDGFEKPAIEAPSNGEGDKGSSR